MSERLADVIRRRKRSAVQVRDAQRALPADKCACGADSGVTDTRSRGVLVARRRGCPKCGASWSTVEVRAHGKGELEAGLVTALLIGRLEELLARMKAGG